MNSYWETQGVVAEHMESPDTAKLSGTTETAGYKKMAINKRTRKEVYEKFNGHCAYCGEKIAYKDMQVDHIIPKHHYSEEHKCLIVKSKKFTEYGVDDTRNLHPACRVCNKFKAAFPLEVFRAEIEAQTERVRKYSSNFRMAEKYGLVSVKKERITFYYESL